MNLESVYWNTVRLIFKIACDVCLSQAVLLNWTACDVCLSQAVLLNRTACDVCLSQVAFDWPPVMLFYIAVGAPQAVPGTACVEANRTACTEVYYSSAVCVSAISTWVSDGNCALDLLLASLMSRVQQRGNRIFPDLLLVYLLMW
jgi:hypothetical protein